MLDLSQVLLGKIFGTTQYILIICIIVILVAYYIYRKRQV